MHPYLYFVSKVEIQIQTRKNMQTWQNACDNGELKEMVEAIGKFGPGF